MSQIQDHVKYPVVENNIWGPQYWFTLLNLAATFPKNPTTHDISEYKTLFKLLFNKLPCRECIVHSNQYVSEHPMNFTNNKELFMYVCNMKNNVAQRIGKKTEDCSSHFDDYNKPCATCSVNSDGTPNTENKEIREKIEEEKQQYEPQEIKRNDLSKSFSDFKDITFRLFEDLCNQYEVPMPKIIFKPCPDPRFKNTSCNIANVDKESGNNNGVTVYLNPASTNLRQLIHEFDHYRQFIQNPDKKEFSEDSANDFAQKLINKEFDLSEIKIPETEIKTAVHDETVDDMGAGMVFPQLPRRKKKLHKSRIKRRVKRNYNESNIKKSPGMLGDLDSLYKEITSANSATADSVSNIIPDFMGNMNMDMGLGGSLDNTLPKDMQKMFATNINNNDFLSSFPTLNRYMQQQNLIDQYKEKERMDNEGFISYFDKPYERVAKYTNLSAGELNLIHTTQIIKNVIMGIVESNTSTFGSLIFKMLTGLLLFGIAVFNKRNLTKKDLKTIHVLASSFFWDTIADLNPKKLNEIKVQAKLSAKYVRDGHFKDATKLIIETPGMYKKKFDASKYYNNNTVGGAPSNAMKGKVFSSNVGNVPTASNVINPATGQVVGQNLNNVINTTQGAVDTGNVIRNLQIQSQNEYDQRVRQYSQNPYSNVIDQGVRQLGGGESIFRQNYNISNMNDANETYSDVDYAEETPYDEYY